MSAVTAPSLACCPDHDLQRHEYLAVLAIGPKVLDESQYSTDVHLSTDAEHVTVTACRSLGGYFVGLVSRQKLLTGNWTRASVVQAHESAVYIRW